MRNSFKALLMLLLVLCFGYLSAQAGKATTTATDTTKTKVDSLKADSLTIDSLTADSLRADSLAKAEAMLTPEQKLCKEVAGDIMKLYKSKDFTVNYNMLMPTIQGFVADYKKLQFVDEISKTRALVVLKDKMYEEINRVTQKDVYFGYIKSDLKQGLTEASDKLTKYIHSRKEDILKEHEASVLEIFNAKKAAKREVDSLKAELKKPEVSEAQDKLQSEFSEKKSNAKALKNLVARLDATDPEFVAKVDEMNRVQASLDSLQGLLLSEKISRSVKRMVRMTDRWVKEKNRDIKNLYEDESERLTQVVMSYIVEEGSYNIDEVFAQAGADDSPEFEMMLKNNIKYKFMNDIVNTFSVFLKYNTISGYRTYRTNVLIAIILFMGLFFYTLSLIRKKKESLFIRRIPGLDAIDDAVGRATEMGKPIIYDSGLGTVTDMDTIASMLILKHVSKTVAEFKAEIYFPSSDPIVMQTAEEMISSGFLDAGCPEDHKKENIFYLAGSQFAFAAGLAGLIARKKPATCLHFGSYAAESLLISESGFNAGAIQVAGTSAVDQIPFFVAACDYTLIGEEIYAAAAYLSREPQIMTNLKVSDYAKVVFLIVFITGALLLTINPEWTFLLDLFETH